MTSKTPDRPPIEEYLKQIPEVMSVYLTNPLMSAQAASYFAAVCEYALNLEAESTKPRVDVSDEQLRDHIRGMFPRVFDKKLSLAESEWLITTIQSMSTNAVALPTTCSKCGGSVDEST